jgi:LacI family transcriptional regulator
VAQVTDILRRDLNDGVWSEFLPGEKSLCSRLQVSRPTVRAALDALRREGLIRIAKGRRARITGTAGSRPRSDSKVVGFLSGLDLEAMESYTLFRISELRHHLQDAGYKLEIHSDPRLYRRQSFKTLERLVGDMRACCWLLHLTNSFVQQWFEKRGVPAIILGSPRSNVHYPSIDRHYEAIARHAVGVVLGLGHRRVVLVVRDSREGGDLASEQGFLQAFEKSGYADTVPRILRHDGTVKNLRFLLNAILRLQSRPTALLVTNPGTVLTVASHLMHCGIQIPRDVSLLALDDERYLSHLTPALARYRLDWNPYAARLSRMVIQLATTGTLPRHRILVMPRFEKGETVAAV